MRREIRVKNWKLLAPGAPKPAPRKIKKSENKKWRSTDAKIVTFGLKERKSIRANRRHPWGVPKSIEGKI